jgi:hypothetical protein
MVLDMQMNCSAVCVDLWQIENMKMNSNVVSADLWQVVDMQMNIYVVCVVTCGRNPYADEQLFGLC